MELLRLTNAYTGKPIYLNIQKLNSISCDGDTVGRKDGSSTTCVNIVIDSMHYKVEESLAELLAMFEGRDPNPAKILFGKKDRE